jgi:hypothetical protein
MNYQGNQGGEAINITNANSDPFTHFVQDLIMRSACGPGVRPTFEQATLWWEEMDLDEKAQYFQRAQEYQGPSQEFRNDDGNNDRKRRDR